MQEQQNPWQVNGSKQVYENPWISVTEYDVINPSGGEGIYGKVHFKNTAIGIITLTADMKTHLVGQFRFALNQYSWEIPEGGAPAGSDPLEGAKRELLEETGLKAGEWQLLLNMHLSNSVSDEYAFIYLARQLTQHAPEPEETEQLVIRELPFDEVFEMVKDGRITDSISIAAILKVKLLMAGGL